MTKNLIDLGFDKNEVDKILDENGLKNELEMQNQLNSLMTDDKNETLLNMYKFIHNNATSDLFDFIFDGESNEALLRKYFFKNQKIKYLDMFIDFFGQFMQQYPEYDLDEISLERFYSELIESEFFNIIHTSDGKKFIIIDDEKEIRELEDSEEEYMRSISEPAFSKIYSNLEILNKELEINQEILEKIKALNAPSSILDNQNQIINNYKKSIAEIEARISERRNKNKKTAHSAEDYNPTEVNRE